MGATSFGIGDNSFVTADTTTTPVQNIYTLLEASGHTWKDYTDGPHMTSFYPTFGFRPETSVQPSRNPNRRCRNDSSLSQRADRLCTGSGLPQRWYELTERTPRPRFDFLLTIQTEPARSAPLGLFFRPRYKRCKMPAGTPTRAKPLAS